MLICPYCGEKESFMKRQYYNKTVIEWVSIDSNDNIIDFLDSETRDSELVEEDNPICRECHAETEEISNEKDYHTFIWEHIDKNGDWDKDGVDEDQRDPDYWNSVISKKV